MPCWIALHTSITTEAASGAWDPATVQQAVARIALGFSPRVALLDEAVLVDVTGSLRLFGGLTRLTQLLHARLLAFFESNQATALIRRAQGATSLIAIGRLRWQAGPSGTEKKRVADLPMHTLSAARPHLGVLGRIGCRSWDDILRLPRHGLARRFGAELLEALDRARGTVADEYTWQVLPEHFEEKIELNALVTHGPALMAGAGYLLTSLQAWLLGRQSGICALQLIWHLDKRRDIAPTGQMEVRTAQPAQDLRHVTRLIAEQLAQQKLPAPVHALSLRSLVTEKLANAAAATASLLVDDHKQSAGDISAVELIERLSARLGPTQVRVWQPRADHRPEQMQRWVNAQEAIEFIARGLKQIRARGKNGLNKTEEDSTGVKPEARTEALYPTWLLPEPLKLATAGNNPVYQGKLVRLTGPQRLEATGWLRADSGAAGDGEKSWALRDYFIYRSQQGSLLWIYSERLVPTPQTVQQRAWYLHGFFA